MKNQMTKEEIEAALAHCTGGDEYHRHGLMRQFLFTDGVYEMAEMCQAHWLVDVIASWQHTALKDPMLRQMQFWTLTKRKKDWIVTCDRDKGDTALKQVIKYSDFPLESMKIWVQYDGQNIIAMLPSEY